MPNIKDKTTVNAIARAYCSNGRNKLEALKTIGYSKSYYSTRGIGKVYSNVRVIAAIKAIDAKSVKKATLTIQSVLDNLSWAINQAKTKNPPDLAAIARLSELQGKYLSMFSESGNNAATGLNLNFSVKPPESPDKPKTVKIG